MDCSPPRSSVHVIVDTHWSAYPLQYLQNTGVCCHSLLQGSFPTQGSNPCLLCLLHWEVGSLSPTPPVKPKVLVSQSCLTLWDPMDCSQPSSSEHGILQARILEWVAISFSGGIFPIQGWNPGLPHCRQILYHLSHQGSPSTWYGGTEFSFVNKKEVQGWWQAAGLRGWG